MILRKIKQLLGMGSESKGGRSDQEITLQQEGSEPDTRTEAAVKGTDDTEDESDAGDVDEPVATGTDAEASTESLVDEAETEEHPESRAEPAEAAGPSADDETTDVDEVDPAEEPESPDVDTGDADADGTPVDEVKGIGPAYSDRLGEIGIHSIGQLAAADAEEVAGRIAVAEKTVTKWIDRAQEHSE